MRPTKMRTGLASYASIWWLHLRASAVKRVDHLANIAGGLVLAYALAFLWRTLYKNEFVPVPVPIDAMITYAVLGSVLSTAFQTDIVFQSEWKIRTGDIVTDLMRPLRWQGLIMAEYFGISAAQLVALAVPVIAVSALFLGFEAPASRVALAAFIPSVVLGVIINFGIVFLVLLLAFSFGQVGGFEYAVRGLRPLLTGAFVPLWLFPAWVRGPLELSPFPAIFYDPLAIYVGVHETSDIPVVLARQAAWAIALTGLGWLLSSRAIRKLAVQGG